MKEFEKLIEALSGDPQFAAEVVMRESLAEAMGPMNDVQSQSMERVIVQLSRALDEAGLLTVPKDRDFTRNSRKRKEGER